MTHWAVLWRQKTGECVIAITLMYANHILGYMEFYYTIKPDIKLFPDITSDLVQESSSNLFNDGNSQAVGLQRMRSMADSKVG